MRSGHRRISSASFALAVVATLAMQHTPAVAADRDLKVVGSVRFAGGTDLTFAGDLALVGSWAQSSTGGLHVIDISTPTAPKVIGRHRCWGNQNDVGVLGTTVVMGMHNAAGPLGCAQRSVGGLRILDISDPTTPVETAFVTIAPAGTHTVTVVGETGYVYANPGGLSTGTGQRTTIVDIRDPHAPRIVGTFTPPRSTGCHDINVNADATRAYCAGSNVTQIWDITDPVAPVVISEIVNPAIFFHHGSVPSPDGTTLAIADEAFGAHACDGSGRSITGSLWFYDISDERNPVLRGVTNPAPTQALSVFGWCTAHNFTFIPGTTWLSIASYRAGTQLVDYADPSAPRTVAWVIPPGGSAWSSYYHEGYIYTGDTVRGFDVISLEDVPRE